MKAIATLVATFSGGSNASGGGARVAAATTAMSSRVNRSGAMRSRGSCHERHYASDHAHSELRFPKFLSS